MRRRAFSLVELLTVLGILAILYAVLMPVVLQVKKYAQQYVAGNSIMKLGTATSMYIADCDDTFPIAYYPITPQIRQNWFGIVDSKGEVDPKTGLLAPYLKGKMANDAALQAFPWMGDASGFGYNWGYIGSDYYVPSGTSNRLVCRNPATSSVLYHDSETILFGTSIFIYAKWLPGGDDQPYRYGFIDPPKVWFGNPTLDFRHMGDRQIDDRLHQVTSSGQALVVYVDGHLKTMKQKQAKDRNFDRGSYGDQTDASSVLGSY